MKCGAIKSSGATVLQKRQNYMYVSSANNTIKVNVKIKAKQLQ